MLPLSCFLSLCSLAQGCNCSNGHQAVRKVLTNRGIHHFAKPVKGSVFLVTQARVVFADGMRHLKKANLMPT